MRIKQALAQYDIIINNDTLHISVHSDFINTGFKIFSSDDKSYGFYRIIDDDKYNILYCPLMIILQSFDFLSLKHYSSLTDFIDNLQCEMDRLCKDEYISEHHIITTNYDGPSMKIKKCKKGCTK